MVVPTIEFSAVFLVTQQFVQILFQAATGVRQSVALQIGLCARNLDGLCVCRDDPPGESTIGTDNDELFVSQNVETTKSSVVHLNN